MANKGTPTKNDVKEGGLLKKWFQKKMTDDKGLFQGGDRNRIFGRIRDRRERKQKFDQEAIQLDSTASDSGNPVVSSTADSLTASETKDFTNKEKRRIGRDIVSNEILAEKAGYDMYTRNRTNNPNFVPNIEAGKEETWEIPAYSREFNHARQFALDFNVNDKDQVLEMQKRLNAANFKGKDGKPLVEDGMLGENTMEALRAMQSEMLYENAYAKQLFKDRIKRNQQIDALQNTQEQIAIDVRKNQALQNKMDLYIDPHDGNEVMGPDETFELGNEEDGYPA